MKLILSRKGFDSSAGGGPSPVLPDGRLLSLPIPDSHSSVAYGDIQWGEGTLGPWVEQLSAGRVTAGAGAHIDPDLDESSLPRQPGWRPLFGQAGSAQAHLRNHGVGPGDCFLFFGLFRQVEPVAKGWRWLAGARPFHGIWGWLQVRRCIDVTKGQAQDLEWAAYHPHCRRDFGINNVLYVARRRLALKKNTSSTAGAGVFSHASPERRLTAPDATKVSDWALPSWFYPRSGRAPLSYHRDPGRWRRTPEGVRLRAVARGQEFVLDGDRYPEAIDWTRQLIEGR